MDTGAAVTALTEEALYKLADIQLKPYAPSKVLCGSDRTRLNVIKKPHSHYLQGEIMCTGGVLWYSKLWSCYYQYIKHSINEWNNCSSKPF